MVATFLGDFHEVDEILCEAVTDKTLNKGHGLNSGEGGEVTGGEVSMERSKEVRWGGGGGVRITTR